eukprot:scaffold38589_cov40-Attheya_sp.AAC.1
MGTTASKDASPWGGQPQQQQQSMPSQSPTRNSMNPFFMFSSSSSSSSRTQCEAPAPPPLPPLGGDMGAPPPPPAPEQESTSTPSSSSSSEAPSYSSDSIADAAKVVSAVPNPGPFEQANMDAKRLVALDTFDGARVDINKQLSPYMLAMHSFWLGTSMLPDGRNKTYTFVTQVHDGEGGLLMARLDPEKGSVDGRIHRALLGGLALGKLQVGVSAEGATDQLLAEVDLGGATWTGNVKYGSMGGGLVYGCNYFQGITPALAVGAEGMYVSANQSLMSSYTLKYNHLPSLSQGNDSAEPMSDIQKAAVATGGMLDGAAGASSIVMNFNAAQGLLALNYKRIVTPNRVTLGAELQCSPVSLDSQVAIGAEFKLQRSKVCVCVDGTGRIQTTLEAKLGIAPGSPSLNFAAEVDHAKDHMKFGYGIDIQG